MRKAYDIHFFIFYICILTYNKIRCLRTISDDLIIQEFATMVKQVIGKDRAGLKKRGKITKWTDNIKETLTK